MHSFTIATAAAILLFAGPSAAAQQVESDATCLVLMVYSTSEADKIGDPSAEMQDFRKALDGALTFYTGSLTARVPNAELAARLAKAKASIAPLSRDQRLARTLECIHALGPAMRAVGGALDAGKTGN